jgi:small subunit ribosomal protein S16
MVRLRLRRVGRKNQPSFRIVAASKESPRDGKFLEIVGFYNARTNPETVTFKEDKIFMWLKNGAQPSDAVDRIFKTHGVWDRYERFKAGEDLEAILKDAAEAAEARKVNPKTRFSAPTSKPKVEEVVEEAPAEEVVEEVVEEKAAEEVVEEAAEEKAAEEVVEEVVEEKAVEEVVEEAAEEEKTEEAEKEAPVKKAPKKAAAKKKTAKKKPNNKT